MNIWPQLARWPFYGASPNQPMRTQALHFALKKARDKLGIDSSHSFHSLCHSAATHLLERGRDIEAIRDALGQGLSAVRWSDARAIDILPVPYFRAVFTLPAEIAAIAFCNRELAFDILFKTVAENLRRITGDPRHGRIRIGGTAVLHT